jgi:uroporphyrinogen-III synthase
MSGRLAGRTIVVTRATEQAGALRSRLAAEGAAVIEVPTIAVLDALDGGRALARALAAPWDWVVVTSPNGVRRLAVAAGTAAVSLSGLRVAVIGPGTADALRAAGVEPALVPVRAVAEGLVDEFPAGPGRVLVTQGDRARPTLVEGLRAHGWVVHPVVAYRTVDAPVPAEQLDGARRADAIAFTSGSTVEGWVSAAGPEATPPIVVSIGPVTTATANRLGVTVHATAEPHTLDGIVDALAVALAR